MEQKEIRKKKSSGDTIQNGKRRQHYHNNNQHTNDHHHHHTKKQKNGTTVDDDLDLVRVKPNNQVPIVNFWTAMEPYFRPITEDDRKYLMEKSTPIQENSATLLQIPPLGQFYLDKWEEEEQIMLVEDTSGTIPAIATATTMEEINANNNTVTTSKSSLHDTAGNTLLGRLMSSLILEPMDIDTYSEDEEDDYDSQTDQSNTDDDEEIDDKVITEDDDEIVGMEERLRRELQYVGLLSEGGLGDDDDDEETDWHAREDDEISAQLRRLGKELQEQTKVNEFRKERLLQVVDTQLQYDQYRQVLDVLDVQVEQSYLKRFRVQKAKKRKSGSSSKTALSEHTLAAMEKRNMCINELGAIFKEKNCVLPTKSIYDEDVLTV
ncbi:histone acetyltransferases subunit 3-domain-containing protein [Circinella umbellata]|nr:histone acetyltransferases subunit 3-domain-containing protein [Circinella umbellata]